MISYLLERVFGSKNFLFRWDRVNGTHVYLVWDFLHHICPESHEKSLLKLFEVSAQFTRFPFVRVGVAQISENLNQIQYLGARVIMIYT
jgi:hypothetical protein